MFRYKFYESRLNSFKVIVIISFITPIYPLLPQFRALIPGGSQSTFDMFFYVVSTIYAEIFSLLCICSRSMSFRPIPLDYQ